MSFTQAASVSIGLAENYVKWANSTNSTPILVIGYFLVIMLCGSFGRFTEDRGKALQKVAHTVSIVVPILWAAFTLITIFWSADFCRFFGWII